MAKASDETHGRKTVEELRAYYEAFESVMDAEESKLAKERQAKIIKHFKLGVRYVCAPRIWQELQTAVGVDSQAALARRFGFDASIVSRGFSQGALSLENVLLMLSELREEFNIIKSLPSLEERALGGYAEACRFARTLEGQSREKVGLSRPAFFALKALYEHSRWLELELQVDLGDDSLDATEVREEWKRLTNRILAHAVRESAGPLPYSTPEHLQRLHREWGEAFWSCYEVIAYRWIGGDRE